MSSESEQVIVAAFHAMRSAAKAEQRGRNKGAQRIMEAVDRRIRGEVPCDGFSDVPFPEHMREKP